MADRSVVIRLRGEIGDFQAKMVAAGKSVGDVANKMTAAEKESAKFRQGLSSVGNVGGKVALGTGAALGAAVAAAANFNQSMSLVRAATHESAENMDALREAAIRAGADTAFSASEAASGIEALAKAGVQTADILNGGLQGALDLAAAGTIDVGVAAETAATAMTMFGLSGEQVPHIADLLAAAAGKAQGEVTDMAYALQQSGLVADQVGLSIEETTGGLAAFASAGLLGSDAGTSFKTMLGALTPNSEKAAGAMASLGINAYDAQGNFIGLAEFAGNLRNGLKDLTDEQRQSTLETIFGSDAVRAASVLYEEGAKGVQSWIKQVDDSGYAAETAGIKLDNLKGDLEALKGSLETALIGTGDGSTGLLRGLTQGATDAVNAFNGLTPEMQNTVAAMLGITTITGGGLWFGSKVVQGVANTREAITNLGVSSTTTSRAMRGLGGAAAGLAAGYAAAAAIRAIQEATDETLPGVETLTRELLSLQDAGLSKEFDSVGESLRRITDKSFTEKWGDQAFADMDVFGIGEAGSLRRARAEIEALDAAFANIATSGSPERAFEAFSQFAAGANLTVSEQRDLLDLMPQLEESLAGTTNAAELAGEGAKGAAGGFGDLADGMSTATAEAYTLQNAMDILFGALDADRAKDSWTEGLHGLTKALRDANGATLDGSTKRGRNDREDIRSSLDDLRTWAEAVYDKTGNAKQLEKNLLAGREAIIKQGEAAGISREEMEKYLRKLGLTPKEIRTDVRLIGAAKAEDAIDGVIYKARILKDELLAMSRMRVDVHVRGSAIDGYASGGYTGNLPIDSVAGVVHGREFVVNAKATAENRALLEAMNRGVRGYRDGGYVAAQSASSNYHYGAEIDYDRLAAAMSRARPMYGDVHVQPHNYDEFRRQMERDRRLTAGGGVRF